MSEGQAGYSHCTKEKVMCKNARTIGDKIAKPYHEAVGEGNRRQTEEADKC